MIVDESRGVLMKMPRFRMRWTIRALMIAVAFCAVGLLVRRVILERDPVYRMIQQLRHGELVPRIEAAKQLGTMGPKAVMAEEALNAAWNDPEPRVRKEAMDALARIGSRYADPIRPLVAEIEIPPNPRSYRLIGIPGSYDAVESLAAIRPSVAVLGFLLRRAMRSPDHEVRQCAIRLLCKAESWTDPSSPALASALVAGLDDPWFDLRKQVAETLSHLDRTARKLAVAKLGDELRNPFSPRSFEATLLLRMFEPEARAVVPILLGKMRGGILIAAFLLGELGPLAAPAAPELIPIMTRSDADRSIQLSLRNYWNRPDLSGGGAPELARLIADPNAPGRCSLISLSVRAIHGMGEAVEQQTIHNLIAILQGTDDEVPKRGAAAALGEFGPKAAEAIPVLEKVLRSPMGPARTQDSVAAANRNELTLPARATVALGQIGSEGNSRVIAILADLLESDDATVRNYAAIGLEHLGPKARAAVPALAKALKSPDVIVRRWSSMALSKIGGAEVRAALPALRAALDDEDPSVRSHAAEIISQFAGDAPH